MIKDLSKSIKADLYERATSPLFGAVAISWCFWNYKTIFILLSSLPVTEKFEYIEAFLYGGIWPFLSKLFIYPVLSALLFIFVYPCLLYTSDAADE